MFSHPSLIFLAFGFSVFWGIVFGSMVPSEWTLPVYGLGILKFGVILFITRGFRMLVIFSCLGLLIGMIMTEYSLGVHADKTDFLRSHTNSFSGKTMITGRITDIMGRNENLLRYRLHIEKVGSEKVGNGIHLFLSIPENLKLTPGDRIHFDQRIDSLEGKTSFHYERYGWIHDAYGQARLSSFMRLGEILPPWYTWLTGIRTSLALQTRMLYPDPEGALALGMIVGDTHFFTEDMNTDFSRSGLSHLVAVSGSNIALVILFLSLFLRYLPLKKRGRTMIVVGGVCLYCLIVGWNIPALRAGAMGILSYLVLVSGRRILTLPLLMVIALSFLMIEPLMLIADLSFQLSFVAVWGLIVLHEPFDRLLRWIPNQFDLRSALIVILTASFVTLPLIVTSFGSFPILSIPANILVAPFIAIGTILGIVSVAVSYVSHFTAFLIGYIPYSVYHGIILVSTFFGGQEWSMLSLRGIELYRPWILTGFLFFITWMSIEYMIDMRTSSSERRI